MQNARSAPPFRCYSLRFPLMSDNQNRSSLAVAFCSCAVLVTEVTLTRIFSVTLMYHYAFLVLSITLFGLGLGGIFHFVSDIFRRRPESLSWLALSAAVALPLCLGLILRLPFLPQLLSPANAAVLVASGQTSFHSKTLQAIRRKARAFVAGNSAASPVLSFWLCRNSSILSNPSSAICRLAKWSSSWTMRTGRMKGT